jgi:hypothetical protein
MGGSRTSGVSGRTGSVGALLVAARSRRQTLAATVHASLRQLEGEALWGIATDPELVALRASLEAARDELARAMFPRHQRNSPWQSRQHVRRYRQPWRGNRAEPHTLEQPKYWGIRVLQIRYKRVTEICQYTSKAI